MILYLVSVYVSSTTFCKETPIYFCVTLIPSVCIVCITSDIPIIYNASRNVVELIKDKNIVSNIHFYLHLTTNSLL